MTFASESKLEVIAAGCFYNTGIEGIVVPKSVTLISKCAFQDCKKLAEVVFEEGSRLRKIGEYAFYDCTNLKSINLQEGLEEIGLRAFTNSRLESIAFPKSLRVIC